MAAAAGTVVATKALAPVAEVVGVTVLPGASVVLDVSNEESAEPVLVTVQVVVALILPAVEVPNAVNNDIGTVDDVTVIAAVVAD